MKKKEGNNVNIAICDDEFEYRKKVKMTVQDIIDDISLKPVIDEYSSGEDLINSNKKYDIIFLDIEMNGMNGVETAHRYNNINDKSLIIFLTSHLEYSTVGYKVNAFRFIDKQDDGAEMLEALQSAFERLNDKIIIIKKVDGENVALKYDEIIYIETEKRKTRVRSIKEEFMSNEKISSFADRLSNTCFYLSHKSFLINLNHITRYKGKNIYMNGDKLVLLSEKKQAEFKKVFLNWRFQRGNR